MGSIAMLKGPMVYVNNLLQLHTLLLTIFYWITLGAKSCVYYDSLPNSELVCSRLGSTLYSCLILGNYMLVFISSFLQVSRVCCRAGWYNHFKIL